jgi:hypothetical protein
MAAVASIHGGRLLVAGTSASPSRVASRRLLWVSDGCSHTCSPMPSSRGATSSRAGSLTVEGIQARYQKPSAASELSTSKEKPPRSKASTVGRSDVPVVCACASRSARAMSSTLPCSESPAGTITSLKVCP